MTIPAGNMMSVHGKDIIIEEKGLVLIKKKKKEHLLFFTLIQSNATNPLVGKKQTQINGALFVYLLAHNELHGR